MKLTASNKSRKQQSSKTKTLHCIIFLCFIASLLVLGFSVTNHPYNYEGLSLGYAPLHVPNEDNAKMKMKLYSTMLEKIEGAVQVSQLDFDVLKRSSLKVVDCASKDYPILMHDSIIIQWVCTAPGEKLVTKAMLHTFEKYLQSQTTTRTMTPPSSSSPGVGLMLDIGANEGYYGLLAAKFGHVAVEFDLQPECISILCNSVLVNGFLDRVRIIDQGVTNAHKEVSVPALQCEGGYHQGRTPVVAGASLVPVQMHPLSHFITDPNQEIMMMKVDTEGNEQPVLEGAMSFFQNKKIRNAIVEITPKRDVWAKVGVQKPDVLSTLQNILQSGYVIIVLLTCQIYTKVDPLSEYMDAESTPFQFDVWMVPEANSEMTAHACMSFHN